MFRTDNPVRFGPPIWIVEEIGHSLLVLTFDGRTDRDAERERRADVQ